MTPVGDAITEAFARQKWVMHIRVRQQTLRSTRLEVLEARSGDFKVGPFKVAAILVID